MRPPPLLRWCAGIGLAIVAVATPLRAEGARIVEAPALPPFTNLQEAVDAATDGDTILIAEGVYEGFTIDDKALNLVAVPNQFVRIEGTVTVLNLAVQRTVLLSRIDVQGVSHPGVSDTALIVKDCSGPVRVESCDLKGGAGWYPHINGPFGDGGHACTLSGSAQIAFSGCTMIGGHGGGDVSCDSGCTGGDGGTGALIDTSKAAFYWCLIKAGGGGDGTLGGDGGEGSRLDAAWVFAAGSTFKGGFGGEGGCLTWAGGKGGDAGAGLYLDATARAALLDTTLVGAAGGAGIFCGSQGNGQSAPGLGGTGTALQYSGASRHLETYGLEFDESTLIVVVQGQPGDLVRLRVGTQPAFEFQPSIPGVHLVRGAHTTPLYEIPATGMLVASIPIPDLTTHAARNLHLQAGGRDVLGMAWLSNPTHVLLLDREAPPDCNGNGQSDLADVLFGISQDCGQNLVPDVCDPDCDGDGSSDDCELLSGTQFDCDDNGIPDTCDVAQGTSRDCNGNGVPDRCDLQSGVLVDENYDGKPDGCQPRSTWWVDPSAPSGGNGSAAAPFSTIAAALPVAIDGDEILLRDGIYTGIGNRGLEFAGRAVILRSENGPAACILDLQEAGRAFLVNGGSHGTARIQGLTFLAGNDQDGGGALRISSPKPPEIIDCVFQRCHSPWGAAIFVESGGVSIADCSFVGNVADALGGAVNFASFGEFELDRLAIVRCSFQGNVANEGGAIYDDGLPIQISHSVFQANRAHGLGGAIAHDWGLFQTGSMKVDDCLFEGNSAAGSGGAISIAIQFNEVPTARFTGTTFVSNSAGGAGGAVSVVSDGAVELKNCIVWDNDASHGAQLSFGAPAGGQPHAVDFCDVQGGLAGVWPNGNSLTWGPGNLDIDPQFADPDGPDNNPLTVFDNDYRPIASSPVDDAGNNALVPPDLNDINGDGNTLEPTPLDLDLTRRFVEDLLAPNVGAGIPPLVDLGCYEHP